MIKLDLYVGTRKWKSSFLIYNKYLDVIDKGKKAEDKCFSDWYRYEIELKFDVTSGASFKAVSQVKTEEDFKVFHAK